MNWILQLKNLGKVQPSKTGETRRKEKQIWAEINVTEVKVEKMNTTKCWSFERLVRQTKLFRNNKNYTEKYANILFEMRKKKKGKRMKTG